MTRKPHRFIPTNSSLYLTAVIIGALSNPALAGAGDAASTYGLGPANAGSAQAFSAFEPGAWALYYNPAAMARSPEGELSVVLQHGDQELRAKSLGGSDPLVRQNDILSDTSSELLLLGIKTRIGGASETARPMYLGINVGLDEYASNILPFQANTAEEGQFMRYQSQPLYLAFGAAVRDIVRGVDAGFSARLTLAAKARLEAVSDLAGNTDSEQLSLEGSPGLSPALGLNIRMSELFCGSSPCMPFGLDRLEAAVFWRDASDYEVSVDANVVIPGVVPDPGLDLALSTIDSFQPEVFGGSLLLPLGKFELVASLEQQKWSELESKFAGDSVRNQADMQFVDVTVPRLGASFRWSDQLRLFGGVALEDSPLKSSRSQDVNFLDSDKMVLGVGGDYRLDSAPVINAPVVLSLAYQYQKLDKRDFELTSINSPSDPAPYETVRADGDIQVISLSASVKF
ncbi:MAG: outer membrane protein transport protein [Alcanivoracaceae bacterium]|nr:outer membrane protein transport protein [Alcanivoracaceae bacterium]